MFPQMNGTSKASQPEEEKNRGIRFHDVQHQNVFTMKRSQASTNVWFENFQPKS